MRACCAGACRGAVQLLKAEEDAGEAPMAADDDAAAAPPAAGGGEAPPAAGDGEAAAPMETSES